MGINVTSRTLQFISIENRFTFLGIEFQTVLTFPHFSFFGGLAPEHSVKLKELFNRYGFDAEFIPDIEITTLSVYIDPQNQNYGFGIEVHDEWKLSSDFIELALKSIQIEIDSNNETVSGSITAKTELCGCLFAISTIYNDGWIFNGKSEYGTQISLNALVTDVLTTKDNDIILPSSLPNITFEDIDICLNTSSQEFSFKSTSKVSNAVKIHDKVCSIALGIDVNYNPREKLTGKLDGSLSIGDVEFDAEFNLGEPALSLKLDEGSKLNFKEVAEFFLGEELFNTLPEDLTDNLRGVEVTRFDSGIDFESKGISLDISTTLKDIRLGTDDLMIATADIGLKLDISDSKRYCKIAIGGKGNIGSAILFDDCRFIFEYDQSNGQTDWALGGLFDAEILGHDLRVEAGFQDKDNVKTLALHVVDPFPAIVFPGVGSFELDDFMLKVEKGEGEKVAWGLSTTFQLDTEADIFDLRSGTVALINDADKSGLKLSADGIDMKIPTLEHLPWFSLDKPELELMYAKTNKQWACHGETGFVAHNVPDMLTRVFPTGEVFTECTINDQKAEFSISLEDGLIEIPAPSDMGNFGNAYFGISEIKIDLMKGGSLTARLALGLPKGLNAIFQPDPKAEDKLEIFRVYNPDLDGDENDLVGIDLTISAERGLVCELDQSPFKFFEITEDTAGKKILDIDLKEFGQIIVEMPVFSLKPDGSFSAAGGFDIKRELQFPLTPLKYLLKQIGLEEVSTVLPRGIPIKGVEFYTEEKGFHSDAFFELFVSDADRIPIPDWIKEGFESIDDIAENLPKALLQYGNINIPQHIHFDVDFSADGSLKFQFSVKDPAGEDEAIPLKLLLPMFPNFIGIELYSIAFGELFGGALLRLDLDIKIDTFDLPSLLASLLIPYDELPAEIKYVLADPRQVQNSFRAENLMIVIIYQAAGIPIPIPLFYDKLGVSYKGLDGFELESVFKFPQPRLELKSIGILFNEIIDFFGKGEDIDTEKLDDVAIGDYTIGANYIRFPKYVSTEEDDPTVGKLLGTQQGFTIKPVKLIGALLNAIKNGSINDLIQVVPVEDRVGKIDLKIFNVLQTHCEYALTTPFEFVNFAYRKLSSFDQSQARQYIEILPPKRTGLPAQKGDDYTYSPVTEDTEGLVIFLKGNLDVAKALMFDTGFGLFATGAGFGLGMQFNGRLPDIFDVHMKGLLAIRKDGRYLLEGSSHLRILDQNIFSGAFYFSNDLFSIEAKAGDGPIRVEGKLEGEFTNEKFYLEGQTSLAFFGLTADGCAKFLITDTEKLVYLAGNIKVGEFVSLETEFKSYADWQRAGMQFSLKGKVSTLLDLTLDADASVTPDRSLQVHGATSMTVLKQKIISANVGYADEVLTFDGHLDLCPGNDLMVVKGDIAGVLSDSGVELAGACTIIIVKCVFTEAKVLITDKEFVFASQLFNLKTFLIIEKHDSGFMLYGTMSPIVFGELLKITCAPGAAPISQYDLGGPSIYISTSPDAPGFRLNGSVSLLGIQTATDIVFNQDGFNFTVSGNIFNVVHGEFTVSGRDLNDTKNIIIKGAIGTEDFQSKAIEGINKAANAIKGQIECFNKKLEEQQRYLDEQKAKVYSLNNEINQCKARITQLKKQIEDKKAWFNRLRWWEKPAQSIVLGVFVAAKGVEIAALYATIGVLEVAKLAALATLEIAKAAVGGAQLVLEGVSVVTGALAQFSEDVLTFTGKLLTIHSASLECQLSAICGGSAAMNFDVTFLGKSYKLENLRFNLLQPQVGVNSLVDALKTKSA